ncbi:hypothetical protein [Pseudoclavibacter sp. RFBI4]|uniref:hypothetical protein n=1 Tax=Pseudoclavibacter sp. RFBI4 TaxID=2080577 RepID=UPI0015E401A1|nr:hypothetical protein [Pseudoclavibacter sp. RFBI4]
MLLPVRELVIEFCGGLVDPHVDDSRSVPLGLALDVRRGERLASVLAREKLAIPDDLSGRILSGAVI